MDKGLKQAFHKGENPNNWCFHPTWIPETRCSLLGRGGRGRGRRKEMTCAWQIMLTNPACSHLQAFPYDVSSPLFPSPLHLAAIRPSRLSSEALFSQKPQPVPLLRAAHPQQSGPHGRVPLCSPPHRPTFSLLQKCDLCITGCLAEVWCWQLGLDTAEECTAGASPDRRQRRKSGRTFLSLRFLPSVAFKKGSWERMSLPLSWDSARSHSVNLPFPTPQKWVGQLLSIQLYKIRKLIPREIINTLLGVTEAELDCKHWPLQPRVCH